MNKAHESPISDHERLVQGHYDSMTRGFYLRWNPDHIHLGVFEPGECPRHSEHIKDSPGVARAVERMIEVIVAPAGISKFNDQLKPLRDAWKSRCFEVRRYCAQKPG